MNSNSVLFNQIIQDRNLFDIISRVAEEWNATDVCKKMSRKLDIYWLENKLFSESIKLEPAEITLQFLKFANIENTENRSTAEKRIQEILRSRIVNVGREVLQLERHLYDYVFEIFGYFNRNPR